MKTALPSRQRALLFGLPVDVATLPEVIASLESLVALGGSHAVQGINAHTVLLASRDAKLTEALRRCSVCTLDGMSCVWVARCSGLHVPGRVSGVDLMPALLGVAVRRGWSCYLLGATAQVVSRLAALLAEQFPGLVLAGYHHGYFSEAEAGEIADLVAAASPTVVFLGMPSPRKELFAAEFAERMGASLVVGVGGSFDVLAGERRRAPGWAQRAGLEWGFRMMQEPRRLAGRYLLGNPRFAVLALRELMRGRFRR